MRPPAAASPCSAIEPVETKVTTTIVGASFSPDSLSRTPARRGAIGSPRSTENTAAASVGEVTAPSSTASSHDSPSARWATTATTVIETAMPSVASDTPCRKEGRISAQLVVRPPSARITASAAKPSACASWASSKWMPEHVLPEQHPHQEVDQEARQTDSRGEQHRQDGEQCDPCPDQQDGVELVDVEGHLGVTSLAQQGRR